ncbi:MAG TPA: hypothetical protein VEG39_04230 [Clostridia bacterium]|nr:hypothetical protein [Clostridia bacterium]
MLAFIKKNVFLLSLLVLFAAADMTIAHFDPVNNLKIFYKNDLEKTRVLHPYKVWEKVFFGNSTVIASYMEDRSDSGYINMGINYGKLTDLDEILSRGLVTVSEDIVIGLNFFTLMDKLPTDPYYIWHRKIYEPYVFFYRDQFKKLIVDRVQTQLTGKPVNTRFSSLTRKELYYGRLSEEKLRAKVKEYESKYGNMRLSDFSDNINSLRNIISFCNRNNIRLRVLWMPWNRYYTPPAYVNSLKQEVNTILAENRIEVLDWSGRIDSVYFHDLGHLNIEKGAPLFTKEIEVWLKK